MRTNLITLSLLLAIFLSGCQKEKIDEIVSGKDNSTDPELLKGNVYPLSQAYRNTRILTRTGSSFETDWENQQEVILASGSKVPLP